MAAVPILFITSSRIGDAVLSSGLVRALAEEIPQARFTIVGSALTVPLFADTPGLARLIALEKRPLGLHWLDLWRQTRGRTWGLVVDLRGTAISGLLRRKRRAVWRPGPGGAHKVVEASRLLKLETPAAPFLYTSAATEARAAALTAGEGPILAVAPAANWIGKTWPAERYATVIRALLGPGGALAGGRLMLLGGAADRRAADGLRATARRDGLIDLVGRVPLLVSYAALKRARLFVGADSGLMHLAAAAGAPTLGLFGPSDERLYGPWGETARSLRGPRSFETIRAADPNLDLAVCHMMDLAAPRVIAAAEALVADTRPAPPAPSPPPPPPARRRKKKAADAEEL
ncbi:MAG: glycosyltransferase family 9 protein [Caulobacteraceae bacterium]|nr:glycosyltransferase family 9 protein [Caulobacteraceae bacterium]